MSVLDKAIEDGKQRGLSKSIVSNGKSLYCGAGIQKYNSEYKVHIFEIYESNMDSEIYEKLITTGFKTLQEAKDYIESNSILKYKEFAAIKGQKLFNPAFNE